jgi:hypothetical protein
MRTTTETEARRETWRDLLPPEVPDPSDLMTSGELLAELNRRRLDVDADTLRLWIRRRILPAPLRRRHEGATRALYHPAYLLAVHTLRFRQGHGERLDELRPHVRRAFLEFLLKDLTPEQQAAGLLAAEARAYDPPLTRDAEEALRHQSWVREQTTGVPTRRIEVAIVGTDGRRTRYTLEPVADRT